MFSIVRRIEFKRNPWGSFGISQYYSEWEVLITLLVIFVLFIIIICRELTSGELSQIFDIIRANVGHYQEDFIKALNQLLSSDISWFEFLPEERKM